MVIVKLQAQRIASGRNAAAALPVPPFGDGEGLQLLLCERHSRVRLPPGMVGLWCPLVNGLWVEALGTRFFIKRGSVFVSDPDHAHEVSIPMRGLGIAIVATTAAWRRLTLAAAQSRTVLPQVFPTVQLESVTLRRELLQLVRMAVADAIPADAYTLARIGQLMTRVQEKLSASFERCPGSSLARRAQIFMRLQRVRNLIHVSFSRDLDIARLSALANYSTGRLIRLFTRVFGESPYAYLLQVRIENARHLMRSTTLNINDVWRSVGFENRASFARSFKKCSGRTASDFRSTLQRAGNA